MILGIISIIIFTIGIISIIRSFKKDNGLESVGILIMGTGWAGILLFMFVNVDKIIGWFRI